MITHVAGDVARAWARLARSLPSLHAEASAGGLAALEDAVRAAPAVTGADLAGLGDEDRRIIALDILLVESFARRHGGLPGPEGRAALDRAAAAVAAALDIRPILTYPLYIRHNPLPPEPLRTFTPLPAEARFIRMHRAVEDDLDGLIPRLDAVLAAAAPDDGLSAALAAEYRPLAEGFRRVNRMMAAFQDPIRMPVADFTHGFRPYYASATDPATGAITLEGPSGLQSPTFRAIAMQMGYADHGLDHWTTHLAGYHEPSVRADLERRRARRDAGGSLADAFAARFGGREQPRLHPSHAASLPDLMRIARAGGWLGAESSVLLAAQRVVVDAWPAGAPEPSGAPAPQPPPSAAADAEWAALPAGRRADLARFAGIEAMLFGFHFTHVATAAAQIGRVPGTGGTSGVDFLLIALYRRAFPALWSSGLGGAAARAGVIEPLG